MQQTCQLVVLSKQVAGLSHSDVFGRGAYHLFRDCFWLTQIVRRNIFVRRAFSEAKLAKGLLSQRECVHLVLFVCRHCSC